MDDYKFVVSDTKDRYESTFDSALDAAREIVRLMFAKEYEYLSVKPHFQGSADERLLVRWMHGTEFKVYFGMKYETQYSDNVDFNGKGERDYKARMLAVLLDNVRVDYVDRLSIPEDNTVDRAV